ncbi:MULTISPECIES: DJ-1/PfpI family protein [Arthrobacter]|uniref:DJ-1/PfpI family protein n=2 Tax=Arthrobacter TaxID=1663 RepID=A0ABU9KJG5_9MICC|nr:DJ-1/PfpI family protein [Arthrobacter sp. YJM1]MDP5226711.1 DJ-1/PfpI family protein [Arthrobacter sp. YJM1]
MTDEIRINALVFPDVTQLDLTGPVQFLTGIPGAVVDLVWHSTDPVPTDCGFSILPTTTFADARPADVIMIPGGQGAFNLLEDAVALDFVRAQARDARYITSVCTGAFVLGAAGLLKGRRVTTHWASHAMLSHFGAIPEQARVVRDGNLITGGGVTSGIDFALTLAAEIAGPDVARRIQLALEYDPQPPFDAGTPARPEADQEFVASLIASNRERREGPVLAAAGRNAGSDIAR